MRTPSTLGIEPLVKTEQKPRRRQGREAPFPLYGLPEAWEGSRRLGGSSYHQNGSGPKVIQALSLSHGSNVVGAGSGLVSETSVPADGLYGGGWLRCVAERLWVGMASTIEEARADEDEIGDSWVEPERPMPDRAGLTVPVQGVPTLFDAVTRGDEWVARARVGGFDITLEGLAFDPARVELFASQTWSLTGRPGRNPIAVRAYSRIVPKG
jgi:hypothetical protein